MDTDKSSWEASSLSSVPRSTYWSSLLSAVPTVLELSFHPAVQLPLSRDMEAIYELLDKLRALSHCFEHSARDNIASPFDALSAMRVLVSDVMVVTLPLIALVF